MPVARVLVVDDDASLRALLADCLDLLGYEVEAAADGRGALEAVRRTRPDVVLLDLRLPDLPGEDVLALIRMIDARIPVIVVSANQALDTAKQVLEQGAFDYIQKPFDVIYLERVVAAALGVVRDTPRSA